MEIDFLFFSLARQCQGSRVTNNVTVLIGLGLRVAMIYILKINSHKMMWNIEYMNISYANRKHALNDLLLKLLDVGSENF